MICKIYNDGSHYVAFVPFKLRDKKASLPTRITNDELGELFEEKYDEAFKAGMKLKEQKAFIRSALSEKFGKFEDILDEYIEKQFKSKLHSAKARIKRFERKAYTNKWNYFVTFTYDNKKQTRETFEKCLKKCLSNLASRRGWLYMMRAEYGEKAGRLHYHALMYIPDGQMVGNITKKRDYSKRLFTSRYRYENDFFTKFGRNDFQKIDDKNRRELKKAIDYIAKYMSKSTDKTIYSRGIPTELIRDVSDNEIVCEMVDFVLKYVMFDDVFDTDNIYVKESVNDSDYYDLSEFEE